MSQITDPTIVARAAEDETAWESWSDDLVTFQRECPDCDHGLLVTPARFCGACAGSGYLTRTERIGA